MSQLLATYRRDGERHRIELIAGPEGRRVIDRPDEGPVRLIAELAPDEGKPQAMAVLNGDGAYLQRARAGEHSLGRILDDEAGAEQLAQAA